MMNCVTISAGIACASGAMLLEKVLWRGETSSNF